MMKNLIVIRHAKSSWEQPLHDFERDLTPKGVENSYKMSFFTKEIIAKDAVFWSSYAKRAVKTARIFVNSWNRPENEIFIRQELYTFDVQEFEEIVKSCPNSCNQLIIFGHNGAITDFVNKFGDIYVENVPTAGFVSIHFEIASWANIKKGKTIKIIVPSQL